MNIAGTVVTNLRHVAREALFEREGLRFKLEMQNQMIVENLGADEIRASAKRLIELQQRGCDVVTKAHDEVLDIAIELLDRLRG